MTAQCPFNDQATCSGTCAWLGVMDTTGMAMPNMTKIAAKIASLPKDIPRPAMPWESKSPSQPPAGSSGSSGSSGMGGMGGMGGSDIASDLMKNGMDTLMKGGICMKVSEIKDIKASLEPLQCLTNMDMDNCDADPKCAWAEMICVPMKEATNMKKAWDRRRGIGIGSTVVKCMAAVDEAGCTAAGAECTYVTDISKCLDAKSATMAGAAKACLSKKNKEACNGTPGCGYAGVGYVSKCVDADTADMMNKITEDAGDIAGDIAGAIADAAAGMKPKKPKMPKMPKFGCFGLMTTADCAKDATCAWFTAPKDTTGPLAAMATVGDLCVDKKASVAMKCSMSVDAIACGNDATCTWADVGATMGFKNEVCVDTAHAKEIAAAVKKFDMGSESLKNLGSNVFKAGTKLKDAVGSGDFTGFDKLSAGDMSSLIGEIAEQAEKGTKMAKAGAEKMLNKLKGAGGWGAIKDWGVDKIAEAGSLLDGLDATDIAAVEDATFDAAMGDFGKVVTWGKDQAKGLADKLKKGLKGDMKKCTAEILAKGKGFLSGLTDADLAAIPKDEFKKGIKSIAESCQKLGAYDDLKKKALKKQVKAAFGDIAAFTEAVVDEIGALVGTFEEDDLKKLTKGVFKKIKGAAIKMMGGAKAAKAFSADKLKELSEEAKAAFNGADLTALAEAGEAALEKLKAVVCKDGKCPGAVTDFVVDHDGSQTDAKILAKFTKKLAKIMITELKVIMAGTPKSTTTRRRLQAGRALTGATANTQTVVRAESNSNAAAAEAAAEGASLGTATTVQVTASDGMPSGQAGKVGNGAGTTTPSLLALALVAAAALLN